MNNLHPGYQRIAMIGAAWILALGTATAATIHHKSPGNGEVPGVKTSQGSDTFFCKDALLGGFDFFNHPGFNIYFPAVFIPGLDKNVFTPDHKIVDMAYARHGTMTFKNVRVATSGQYLVTFRYAFAGGLFPKLQDRPMGLAVNGVTVAPKLHFPRTSPTENNFDVYRQVKYLVHLHAGKNSIELFCLTDSGVSRLDIMTLMHWTS